MSFRQTIAAKIFGLAVFLLLLTIGLAGFLLHEVTRTTQALEVVAHFDVPLTQSVARLDEFGLRRRLAFERWFGALNAVEPNQQIIAEASANYTLFTRKLADEFAAARRIIGAYPRNLAGPGRETLAEVKTLLDQIEPAYQVLSTRQRELLDMQRAGEHEKANQQVDLLNDLQRTVQNQRESVNLKMARWSCLRRPRDRGTRAPRTLVNDCRNSIHGVTGSDGGGANHRPADSPRAVTGQRHARCPARQPQRPVACEFWR
jgi:hypothetical protein